MNAWAELPERLRSFLGLELVEHAVPFELDESATGNGYQRQLITYNSFEPPCLLYITPTNPIQ